MTDSTNMVFDGEKDMNVSVELPNDRESGTGTLPGKVVGALSAFITLLIVGGMLWYSRYGIDFTDEGYYLFWISDPFIYPASTTQFGFIYHPLYELVDGNIAYMRQANILITFGLAWALSDIFLREAFHPRESQIWQRLTVSAGLASASLIIFDAWLLTPNYNSLALQALLIAATGLLLADKDGSAKSLAGWALIGVGGWLAFMAKPTTAAALGAVAVAYLLLSRKFRFRLFLVPIAMAICLLIVSALTIDGSITAFIERLRTGVEFLDFMGGGHSINQLLRLDSFRLARREIVILFLFAIAVYFSAHFFRVKSKPMAWGAAVLAAIFALSILVITQGDASIASSADQFRRLIVWSIPLAAAFLGIGLYRFNGLREIPISQWAAMLCFLAFPYVYALGSNNNYWRIASYVGFFWILSGLILLMPLAHKPEFMAMLLPFGIATQLLTASFVLTGIKSPYRQPEPLYQNHTQLAIGTPGSTLILSKGYADYLSDAIGSAKQAGFKPGTPMIDLTGLSPGLLYALRATSIGQAWTIGGYPGSNRQAVEALKMVPCKELAASWLLAEPGGARILSTDVLTSFRADFAKDYEVVAEWDTAEGAAGYPAPRHQQLLKPTRTNSTADSACQSVRMETK